MNASIAEPVGALGWALVHFLWQGALVGVVAAALLAILREARPQARYAVACGALLACLALPLATLIGTAGDPAPDRISASDRGVGATTAALPAVAGAVVPDLSALVDTARLREQVQPRLPMIVALWSLGAALLALRMGAGLAWVARAGDDGRAHLYWQAQLDALAERMALPRRVLLRVVDDLDTPAVARWLRPVVLVPAALVGRMPPPLLEALLAHELAHVRRHDYLVNLLQGAVEALLFYHPVVWWLSRRARSERELIADDLAAQALGDRRRVALALDVLAGMLPPAPTPTLALAADGGNLMSRIQHLIRPRRSAPGWKAALPVIGISVLCLSFAQANPAATPAPSVVGSVLDAPVAGGPAETRRPGGITVNHGDENGDSYALIDADDADGVTYMSGSSDDLARIRKMRRDIAGDFLWVRRDGREYVTSDPRVLATVRDAWATTGPVGTKMEVLGAQMEKHGAVMEEIGRRMEAQAAMGEADVEGMEALGERMSALGARQAELAALSARLSHDASFADDAAVRGQASRRQRALAVEQEEVDRQMETLGAQMQRHSEAMQRVHAPLEAMGEEMERAGQPMEALGQQMETLGVEMERLSAEANRVTRTAIEQARRDGKLVPLERQASR